MIGEAPNCVHVLLPFNINSLEKSPECLIKAQLRVPVTDVFDLVKINSSSISLLEPGLSMIHYVPIEMVLVPLRHINLNIQLALFKVSTSCELD